MNLGSWFQGGGGISDAEVRAEIWSLGSRHLGEPLNGAVDELNAPDLSPRRAQLLRACVRKLQAG